MFEPGWMHKLSKSFIQLLGIANPQAYQQLKLQLEQLESEMKLGSAPKQSTPAKVQKTAGFHNKKITKELEKIICLGLDENTYNFVKDSVKGRLAPKLILKKENCEELLGFKNIKALLLDLTFVNKELAQILEILKSQQPKIKVVGLSSYLSAALAKSLSQPILFDEVWQRPIKQELMLKLFD